MTDPAFDAALAARLRELRQRSGATSAALAASLGVSPARITEYEAGQKSPSARRLAEILAAVGSGWADLDGLPPPKKTSAKTEKGC